MLAASSIADDILATSIRSILVLNNGQRICSTSWAGPCSFRADPKCDNAFSLSRCRQLSRPALSHSLGSDTIVSLSFTMAECDEGQNPIPSDRLRVHCGAGDRCDRLCISCRILMTRVRPLARGRAAQARYQDGLEPKKEVLCGSGLAPAHQRLRVCSCFAEDGMGVGVLAPQSGLSTRLQALQGRMSIILSTSDRNCPVSSEAPRLSRGSLGPVLLSPILESLSPGVPSFGPLMPRRFPCGEVRSANMIYATATIWFSGIIRVSGRFWSMPAAGSISSFKGGHRRCRLRSTDAPSR